MRLPVSEVVEEGVFVPAVLTVAPMGRSVLDNALQLVKHLLRIRGQIIASAYGLSIFKPTYGPREHWW